jgi:hypothetical protein
LKNIINDNWFENKNNNSATSNENRQMFLIARVARITIEKN